MIVATNNEQDSSNSKVTKYLKMIRQNSNRLLRLINNLIDITKIDAESFEIYQLIQILFV